MGQCAAFAYLCCAAFGQASEVDPVQAKLAAISRARAEGRFAETVRLREEARRLLDVLPPDSPQFAGWTEMVAQVYNEAGWTARARGMLQAALDRTGTLGATIPARFQLLTAIATSWQENHNLPKAVEYLEKAVAASHFQHGNSGGEWNATRELYERLAALQQQLGHPNASAEWKRKLRDLAAQAGDRELARHFEQEEQFGQAAAIYRRALQHAATPQEASELLQNLAGALQLDEKFDEAIAAQRQAIARSEDREQATGARQVLAQILQQAGRAEEAEAVYQEILAGGSGDGQLPALAMYANFLASTKRGPQALAMLKSFEASGARTTAWGHTVLFSALANCSRSIGQDEEAAKYEALIRAKPAELVPQLAAMPSGDELFQQAESAAKAGRTGESFELAMQALDAIRRAENRDQIGWQIPAIAAAMTEKGGAGAAEQLYQSAISLAESWSEESIQPLLNLLSGRLTALIGDPKRRGEARSEVERYRELLIAAHGADSGMQEAALRVAIELGRPSVIPALDLVAFEETVNGGTSEPYAEALGALAGVHEGNQDWEAAAKVRRRIVQLGDLLYPANDAQRGQMRVDLALALANLGQFEEAEALTLEAISVGDGTRRTPGVSFEAALQQIRRMRATSQMRATSASLKPGRLPG
uniref:Tetratricopeptide TPR_4 n=1 Tax=Solibacter usitatus (strain Ellin6076) TaxID=234267 RepID=Q029M5_SOLUE